MKTYTFTMKERAAIAMSLAFCLAGEDIFTDDDGYPDHRMVAAADRALLKIVETRS